MTFWDFWEKLNDNVTMSGVVSFWVIVFSLIEFTPIKFSPLSWIGKRVNKDVNSRMDVMEKGMKEFGTQLTKVDAKINEHTAQSYRNKILDFQNECLQKKRHTLEQFNEVLEAIEKYEEFCKANDVKNEKCKMAIAYVKRTYEKCQDDRDFSSVDVTFISDEELKKIIEEM